MLVRVDDGGIGSIARLGTAGARGESRAGRGPENFSSRHHRVLPAHVRARLKDGGWDSATSFDHHRISCTDRYATGSSSSTPTVASGLRT